MRSHVLVPAQAQKHGVVQLQALQSALQTVHHIPDMCGIPDRPLWSAHRAGLPQTWVAAHHGQAAPVAMDGPINGARCRLLA